MFPRKGVARHVIVRRERDFRSLPAVVGSALIVGLIVPLAIALCFYLLVPESSRRGGRLGDFSGLEYFLAFVVVVAVYLIMVLVYPFRNWSRIRSAGHWFAWGAVVAAGCVLTAISVTLFADRGRIEPILAVGAAVVPAGGVLICVLWWAMVAWQRVVRSRVVIMQDGTMCPTCAYNLRGNTSKVCPECGRPFTFDDLDTTAEAFARRAQAAAARPADAEDAVREESDLCYRPVNWIWLGIGLAVLSLGIDVGLMLGLQFMRMRMRGLVWLAPILAPCVVLWVGISIKARRLANWRHALFAGGPFGVVLATGFSWFLASEMRLRRLWMPILIWLAVALGSVAVASVTGRVLCSARRDISSGD